MITQGIKLINFKKKFKISYVSKTLKSLIKEKIIQFIIGQIYKNNFDDNLVKNIKILKILEL